MNKQTLKALKGSIKKWQGVTKGTIQDRGPVNCPLCQLFLLGEPSSCIGCPVCQKTKKTGCRGTPYTLYNVYGHKKYARAEVKFLKSLLPKVKKG